MIMSISIISRNKNMVVFAGDCTCRFFYRHILAFGMSAELFGGNECLMRLTTDYYNRLLQMSRDYDADLD